MEPRGLAVTNEELLDILPGFVERHMSVMNM
jgi:hypothetical protein